MKTPITDKRAFNVCPYNGTHDLHPKGVCIDAKTARRLELDRAALMEALEELILSPEPNQRDGQFGCGTTPRKRAASTLAAARANFPTTNT